MATHVTSRGTHYSMNRSFFLPQIFCAFGLYGLSVTVILADTNIQLMAYHCNTCHGKQLSDLALPSTLSASTLAEKLLTFKYKQTDATIMPRLVKGYRDSELQAVASLIMEQTHAH